MSHSRAAKVNYSARLPGGLYREFTLSEWKTVRQLSQAGKTVKEVVAALGNQFSPGVVYDRGTRRGLTFARKSAHMGNSNLSLGGKYESEKFEREHPAVYARQTDC